MEDREASTTTGLYVCSTGKYKPALKTLKDLNINDRLLSRLHELCGEEVVESYLNRLLAANIMKVSHTFIVTKELDSKKLRRPLSYMLPILGLLTKTLNEVPTTKKPKLESVGARVLIVCSSITTASLLARSVKLLLDGTGVPIKVELVRSWMYFEWTNMNEFVHADILITNEDYAFDFMKLYIQYGRNEDIKLRRFQFIFDEADTYFDTEKANDFLLFMDEDGSCPKELLPHQYVICGSKWTPEIKDYHLKMVGKGKKSIVFMEDFPETMNFARVRFVLRCAEDHDEKIKMLKETLRKVNPCRVSWTIAATSVENANIIRNVCTELYPTSKIISSMDNLSIVSDDMMPATIGTGCKSCFPYHLLSLEASFNTRIGLAHLRDALPTMINKEWVIKRSIAHYFLTGEEPNFLNFFKVLKSLDNYSCDPKLGLIGNKLLAEESQRLPVCRGIELFGYCNAAPGTICGFRHEFIASDFESVANAPCYGEIEFNVTRRLNPSEYIGTLLEHYECRGRRNIVKTYFYEIERRETLLLNFYSKKENRKPPSNFKQNFLYGFQGQSRHVFRFKRVKIVCKSGKKDGELDTITNLDNVDLYNVDTGEEITASAKKLLYLPLNYARWTPLSLRVILTNLRPPWNEPEYVPGYCDYPKIHENDSIMRATVLVSRGGTVWVDKMATVSQFSLGKYNRTKLNWGPAWLNSDHQRKLIESFRKLGTAYHGHLRLPIDKDEIFVPDLHEHKIEWVHLNLSNATEVHPFRMRTTLSMDPWSFLGSNTKNHHLLHELENELSSWIMAQNRNEFEEYLFKLPYSDTCVVAAREDNLPDGRWLRAIAMGRDWERTTQTGLFSVRVFFVDSGKLVRDFHEKNMFPIPTKFVTKLPFQAVAFSLSHVQPKDKTMEWGNDESKAFRDLIFPISGSIDIDLVFLKVNGKHGGRKKFEIPTSIQYYSAVAFLRDEEIGSYLVRNNIATERYSVSSLVDAFRSAIQDAPIEATSPSNDLPHLIDNNEIDGSDIIVDESNAQGTVAANHEDNLPPNSDSSDSETEASSSSVIFTAHAVDTDDTTFHELALRNRYHFFPSNVVKDDPFYHDFVSPLFPVPDIVNQVFPLPHDVQDDNSSSDDSSSGSGSLRLNWDFINSISDDSDYDIPIDEMNIPDADWEDLF